ncbi:hypothetical protein [Poseidonocella sp. HB161398]|uniref:hypothetical protein n=1 Tax=Poseidonocella sp. HB161398 TaxID=2320855 RepID=UPI001109578F|nr:hypothetical protein [Poseidonocella sp. HB161398]
MQDDPWSGLLNPGERILWQGQPDSRIDLAAIRPVKLAVGTVFILVGGAICGRGLVDLALSSMAGLIPAAFGLVFVALGLRTAVGGPVMDAYERSQSWYTLTSERMLVATSGFGRKRLRDWAIRPETGLVYEEGPPGSVLVSGRSRAGFRRIAEARKVYDLARQVQRSQIRAADAPNAGP